MPDTAPGNPSADSAGSGQPEVYPVPAEWAARAHINADGYRAAIEHARSDWQGYWREAAKRLDWSRFPTRIDESCFDAEGFGIRWFADGEMNVAVNCIDRHLAAHGDAPALIWEPDHPGEEARTFTYAQLHAEVCAFARVLRARGVKKGDRVTLYLPMIPEAAFAMLACARIGAVHSVVFAGFSAEALAGRILDCGSTVLITADEGRRGGRHNPLKAHADEALERTPLVTDVIVIRATGADVAMTPGRDHDYHQLAESAAGGDDTPEPMNAEDPLFILYTSGSTGTPKGIMHTSGGYLLWASLTHELCFDYRPGEVFFCAADIGWVTGHSYIVYGPLANGATTLMYEGVPNWPTPARLWQIADRHQVATLFTAPTALRALANEGDDWVHDASRASLRLLGTVGEPINPVTWRWYHDVVGEGRCPIIDMWWQTETGAGMISPLPGVTPLKPGSATRPLPGIEAQLVDETNTVIEGAGVGRLVIARSWPGQTRGIWGNPTRFFNTYFAAVPGKYLAGDNARRDADGDYWITGRIDDVINVSGHRLGTAEIEGALVSHPHVAEAAVIGVPHEVKGQGIHAFVRLSSAIEELGEPRDVRKALMAHVSHVISPIARPDVVQFVPDLPKTRSGKVMRRILRKIAEGERHDFGDITTLTDPSVVEAIVQTSPDHGRQDDSAHTAPKST